MHFLFWLNPPYCPNSSCLQHCSAEKRFFQRFGYFRRRSDLQLIPRFRCRTCRITFCSTTLTLEHRAKRRGLNWHILSRSVEGQANRQISRALGSSEHLVRLRILQMARHALLEQTHRTRDLKIREPISFDGVENFARSQFEPNNINHAIGFVSHFIYAFNFAPLNRKGKMSPEQAARKRLLEKMEGRFDRDAIRKSSAALFRKLCSMVCPERNCLELLTDRHFEYDRALKYDVDFGRVELVHRTVSSKAPRTYRHILFPVNHLDNLLRHHLKAFQREPISFSKTHGAMILKYALFAVWKNFMRPIFLKPQKQDPMTHLKSPAMAVGIEDHILSFGELFGLRRYPTQIKLDPDWSSFYRGFATFPRRAA